MQSKSDLLELHLSSLGRKKKQQQLGVMRMSPFSVISLWTDQSINRPWICCQHFGLSLVTFQRSTHHSLQGHCSQTHKQGDNVPQFFSAQHFYWPPFLKWTYIMFLQIQWHEMRKIPETRFNQLCSFHFYTIHQQINQLLMESYVWDWMTQCPHQTSHPQLF